MDSIRLIATPSGLSPADAIPHSRRLDRVNPTFRTKCPPFLPSPPALWGRGERGEGRGGLVYVSRETTSPPLTPNPSPQERGEGRKNKNPSPQDRGEGSEDSGQRHVLQRERHFHQGRAPS